MGALTIARKKSKGTEAHRVCVAAGRERSDGGGVKKSNFEQGFDSALSLLGWIKRIRDEEFRAAPTGD